MRFDADVGPDSIEAIVVPAVGRAIDVPRRSRSQHVSTRASRSRLAGCRQSPPGPKRHLRSRSGRHATRSGWLGAQRVPIVATELGLFDRIHVTNPSDEAAEVDLEIVTDGSVTLDPVELTIRAGRTVVVDVAVESRLAALPEFSVMPAR